MERKKLTALIIILVACAYFSVSSNLSKDNAFAKKEVLKQQERIFNEAKFVFRPVVETLDNHSELKVLIEVTSYIYEDILSLDFRKNTMLEFNDAFIRPTDFIILEKSSHKLIGQLIFNATNFKPSDQWGIKVFAFSDHEVLWN